MLNSYITYDTNASAFRTPCTRIFVHKARMDLSSHRLREARIKAGFKTVAEAARALKLNQNTLTSNENGNRPISKKLAPVYAAAYNVDVSWLLFGEGSPEPKTAIEEFQRIPLISRAAAGGLEYRQGIRPVDVERFITVSGLGKGDWFALEVDGDSMDRIAPDGSTIFVNRAENEPLDGKPYIFASPDDNKTTFKLWDKNGFLLPFSMNPDHRPIPVHEMGVKCIGRVRNVFKTLD